MLSAVARVCHDSMKKRSRVQVPGASQTSNLACLVSHRPVLSKQRTEEKEDSTQERHSRVTSDSHTCALEHTLIHSRVGMHTK